MAKLYVEEERGAGPGTKKQRQYPKFQIPLKTKKINHLFTAEPPPIRTNLNNEQTHSDLTQ